MEAEAPTQKLVVAMKGHPGTGKSTLARALAAALRCPLLDKDDVRDSTASLQLSLGGGGAIDSLLNDLSYAVIWRAAQTQLELGLSVIADSPLSRPEHLDSLRRVAAATAARLLVVECRPGDEAEWRRRLELRGAPPASEAGWHKPTTWEQLRKLVEGYRGRTDYDMGSTPKIVVDTTCEMDTNRMVETVLAFVRAHL